MIRLSTAALATLLLRHLRLRRMAQSRVEVGVLECRGSTLELHRRFGHRLELRVQARAAAGRPEPYYATMRRVGVDLGFNQQVAWPGRVLAPTRRTAALRSERQLRRRGRPAPRSASASAPTRWSAAPATPSRSQPLSVQAQTGLSVAAGVAGLELRPAAADRPEFVKQAPLRRHARRRFLFGGRCGLRRRCARCRARADRPSPRRTAAACLRAAPADRPRRTIDSRRRRAP